MNSILENIDTIRRNRGYSQEYLAMQIGMKQAGFSLIMSGERELKYNIIGKTKSTNFPNEKYKKRRSNTL